MTITKKLAKALQENHEDAERFLKALRPIYEQYRPAEPGILWYLMARDTLHFNDGWGEARAEIVNAAPGLLHLSLQNTQRFDEDPKRLDRITREVALGPNQALALLEFLRKHKKDFEYEIEEQMKFGPGKRSSTPEE
jgi:hypothetical protein